MKIGVVFAGGMNKAAYEIGGALALSEHFTAGEIAHISASSIGVLPALALARGETARFRELWLSLAAGDAGRFFLGFLKKPAVREQLYAFVAADLPFLCELYVTVWNFSRRRVEYVRLNDLPAAGRWAYVRAALTVPLLYRGVRIGDDLYFDGAFLDDIPVKPLTDKADDAIFCYYFEPGELFFENAEFDSRLVKIHRFRAKGFLSDTFLLETGRVNEMIAAGRRATESRLWEIFRDADENRVREHLSLSRQETGREFRKLTPDIMLRKVNALMKKMNRQEIREIKEAARERDATLYK